MTNVNRQISPYKKDTRGTFSIYLAIAVMTIGMGVGCAVDMAQATSQKSRLQDLADSTALAAAIASRYENQNRQTRAKDHFKENRNLSGGLKVRDNPLINFNDAVKEVKVEIEADYNYMFMGMFGFEDPVLKTAATVGYMIDEIAPLSIAFAFDTSGSMADPTKDGQIKIDALKLATGDLFDQIYEASERPDLLDQKMTTTFSSYNTDLVDSAAMLAGRGHILMAVDAMQADGGTNSTPALTFAFDELQYKKTAINDNRWAGYVVFMTDGDNNEMSWDTDTEAVCDQMKAEGYRIFTVAFAAPAKGKKLLKYCASSKSDHFDSSDADDLKNAFKLIGQKLGSSTIVIKS